MRKIISTLISFYQKMFSPYLGENCRFYPSCSEYAKEAVLRYGSVKGSLKVFQRFLKCHPFHAGGYDPVV